MNVPRVETGLEEALYVPREAPLEMQAQPVHWRRKIGRVPGAGKAGGRRMAVFGATVAIVAGLAIFLASALAVDGTTAGDLLVLALFVPNVVLTAFSACTVAVAVLGRGVRGTEEVPPGWAPDSRTAILVPVRNENVSELRGRVDSLRADLADFGLGRGIDVFILSDSDDPRAIAGEEALMASIGHGSLIHPPRVFYRRRTDNAQRKPGNVAEWVRRWGGAYDFMLVFDADSRMTADRIAGLIRRMEESPRLGLLQTAVRLAGGESRFGRLQDLSSQLYGRAFAGGVAAWAGGEGNYWGHNALIRVAAFAEAGGLPRLPGRAPFGGDILSHDFVEAAWLRRAGWSVEIDPDPRGTFEGGPQTLSAFHKRDRRWCQGNMQHMRLLPARGLHAISRLHLLTGIMSYLAAPVWLALVLAVLIVQPTGPVLGPTLGALAVLLAPRVLTVLGWIAKRRGWRSRTVILRAAVMELVLSTVIAPIMLVRQTAAVVSVFGGRDCGWKPAGGAAKGSDERLWLEPLVSIAILLLAAAGAERISEWAIALPIALPLWMAPVLSRWFDGHPAAPTAGERAPALLPVMAYPR